MVLVYCILCWQIYKMEWGSPEAREKHLLCKIKLHFPLLFFKVLWITRENNTGSFILEYLTYTDTENKHLHTIYLHIAPPTLAHNHPLLPAVPGATSKTRTHPLPQNWNKTTALPWDCSRRKKTPDALEEHFVCCYKHSKCFQLSQWTKGELSEVKTRRRSSKAAQRWWTQHPLLVLYINRIKLSGFYHIFYCPCLPLVYCHVASSNKKCTLVILPADNTKRTLLTDLP